MTELELAATRYVAARQASKCAKAASRMVAESAGACETDCSESGTAPCWKRIADPADFCAPCRERHEARDRYWDASRKTGMAMRRLAKAAHAAEEAIRD